MAKQLHEIRDPLHGFVRLRTEEREILDSAPVQRLRHIHQLGASMWIYPGATHRRFEHSLGVAELAGRVFDIITQPAKLTDRIRSQVPQIEDPTDMLYWRQVVRLAGLCHDLGHLPFSHAAEKELLPDGLTHEALSERIILEMKPAFDRMDPPIRARDVARIALGPGKLKVETAPFSMWESVLAEIITGDAFGVDRIDYLLRDSYHAGVAYGRFDQLRLLDTLRILEKPSSSPEAVPALTIGIEEGGLQVAEGMALARYYMYTQVYLHPVRRIYDLLLQEFLSAWLPGGRFPIGPVDDFLKLTDNEVMAALRAASGDPNSPGHDAARRIMKREHFRVVYSRNPQDMRRSRDPARRIYDALCERYGRDRVRYSWYRAKEDPADFPVLMRDESVAGAMAASQVFSQLPLASVDYVYVVPELRDEAEAWLRRAKSGILGRKRGEVEGGAV